MAITAPIASTTKPIGDVRNATAAPNAVVTPVAIAPITFHIPIAILTSPHAAAKLPTIIAKVSTNPLCSDIQSPTLVNASASQLIPSTIACPVHSAAGFRNSSHNHLPRGANASRIGLSTESTPASKSKKAGIASVRVHVPKGTKIFSQNHFNPSPIFVNNGLAASFSLLNPSMAGSNNTASFSSICCIFVMVSDSSSSPSPSGSTGPVSNPPNAPTTAPPASVWFSW